MLVITTYVGISIGVMLLILSPCSKPSDSSSSDDKGSTPPANSHHSTKHPSQPPTAQEPISLEQLVKRLQEHVLSNRIRVSEHFQDFDPLRSGSISAAKFRQVLKIPGALEA